jgi:adenylate cyclase
LSWEIERKFLVSGNGWREAAGDGKRLRQGYLSLDPARTVRVRVADDRGFLTVKGETKGISRQEFEFAIPVEEAEGMLDTLCLQPLIEKVRHRIEAAGKTWEVDEFFGENRGLVLAEVELDRETELIEIPFWVGQEVSGDPRFFNASLVQFPFSRWHVACEEEKTN